MGLPAAAPTLTVANSTVTRSNGLGRPTEISKPEMPVGTVTLSPAQLADIRFSTLRDIAWRYSRFFATAHLSQKRASMLLDLLVDEQMAPLESDIQTGSGSVARIGDKAKADEATERDREMIRDLIGADAAKELEQFASAQWEEAPNEDALSAFSTQGPVAEAARASISAAVQGFNPGEGAVRAMTNGTVITPDVEQEIRQENADRVKAILSQLDGQITSQQADSFRKWNDSELNKTLEFMKMISAANHKHG